MPSPSVTKKPASLNQDSDERYYEYYKGVAYAMSHPSGYHQTIIRNFERRLGRYLEGKLWETAARAQ